MPRRSTEKLTKRLVDTLQPETSKDYTVWDSEVAGFGVRVRDAGSKSFIIKYRNSKGQQRKATLGKYGALTVELARKLARSELGKVAGGQDPAEERKAVRTAKTVSELCDCYFADAMAGKVLYRGKAKKLETLKIDEGRIERHIKPLLGKKNFKDLTRHDVEQFMFDVRDGKTAINVKTENLRGRARVTGGQGTAVKSVKLLSSIYSYAIRKNWIETNPCQHVEKPADKRRERFLNQREYQQLGQAFQEALLAGINPIALNAIKVLVLTGCRKNEVLSLRRREVDTEGHCFRFEYTKTGAQTRACGQTALTLLQQCMAQSNSEWVFPAQRGDGPLTDIKRPLNKVRELADLPDVSLHIFRHSYATVAHELGYSELTIAGLLGHSTNTITSRYAHHVDHALIAAADEVSRTILERMRNSPI